LIDIIIVNYNSTDYLLRCIKSVCAFLQELPAKVFVQDNASEDGVDRLKPEFPQVLLSENSYNMGFSRTINDAFFFFAGNGRTKEFLKAKWDALKGMKRILEKRRQILRNRRVDDDYIWGLLEKELFFPRLARRLRKN
jgi:GT2 family glycosyltransferase